MQVFEYDTIIIGSGLSGLTAAWYSMQFGSTAIVTKSELDISNSYFAQGGLAAALAPGDAPEIHLKDTIDAGRGLCDRDPVEVLVTEGRDRVKELIDMGMPFDRLNGELVFGLEGGHSRRRILHAGGDATGKELTSFMLRKVTEKASIAVFEFTAVIRILQWNNCITGVQAIDFLTGSNLLFKTRAVIIATGGLARVYARTTNPHTATGDGIAMAYDAGARISDIEFIQFHPTALYQPGKDAFLISEAVRGEGAWLLNNAGRRFMTDVHPLAELAPRDVVAHAIYREMQEENSDNVFLSLRHLDPEKIRGRFRSIYQVLKDSGFDMTSDLLPVAPAAHYMVGGIRTGLHAETNITGLFVCGEAASSGVMGANRLASNSLLECLVFGKRASEKAALIGKPPCLAEEPADFSIVPENESIFLEYKNEMAALMTDNLGIIRNRTGMEKALKRFEEIAALFENTENEYNLLKIKNIATICILITKGALVREESRGGHIRSDFPSENPGFRVHTIQQKGLPVSFEPVRI